MLYLGKRADVDLPLLSGVAQTNNLHIQHAADLVMAASSRKVGMVGLSFKPGTDDLRESPLVTLAETLIGKGFDLRIFDPAVNIARLIGSNKRYIDSAIPHIELLLTNDLATVFQHADVLVIGQKQSGIQELLSRYPMRSVVDLVGIEELRGVENYTGVCWR